MLFRKWFSFHDCHANYPDASACCETYDQFETRSNCKGDNFLALSTDRKSILRFGGSVVDGVGFVVEATVVVVVGVVDTVIGFTVVVVVMVGARVVVVTVTVVVGTVVVEGVVVGTVVEGCGA